MQQKNEETKTAGKERLQKTFILSLWIQCSSTKCSTQSWVKVPVKLQRVPIMINQSKVKVQWCPYWKSIKPAFFWKCACERKQNRPTAGNLRFSTAKACFKLEYLHQYHNYITQAVKSSAYNLKKLWLESCLIYYTYIWKGSSPQLQVLNFGFLKKNSNSTVNPHSLLNFNVGFLSR